MIMFDVVTTLFAFAFGAAVGSFLNVVVWRLPAGMSLSHPGSHCPKCKHPIRWYDNVPIFGWLRLRGKCRDCGAPISGRYPTVEAITACLFAGLYWFVVREVPPIATVQPDGYTTLIPLSLQQMAAVWAYHALVCATLLAAGLIERDGNRTPARLFYPAIGVGVIIPFLAPWLWAVPQFILLPGVPGIPLHWAIAGIFSSAISGLWASTFPPERRLGVFLLAMCVVLCFPKSYGVEVLLPVIIVHAVCRLLRRFFPIASKTPPAFLFLLWTLFLLIAYVHAY